MRKESGLSQDGGKQEQVEKYRQLETDERMMLLIEPAEQQENFPAIDKWIEKNAQGDSNEAAWVRQYTPDYLTRSLEFLKSNDFLRQGTPEDVEAWSGKEGAMKGLPSFAGAEVLENVQDAREGVVLSNIQKKLEEGDIRAAALAMMLAKGVVRGRSAEYRKLFDENEKKRNILPRGEEKQWEERRERLLEKLKGLNKVSENIDSLVRSIGMMATEDGYFPRAGKLCEELFPDIEKESLAAVSAVVERGEPKEK